MTQMNCKGCNILIDYEKSRDPRAIEVATNTKHDCPAFKKDSNKPKGFPKQWTKKEFKPVEGEMEIKAIQSSIEALNTLVAKHDDAIRALVKELSFKTGKDVSAQLATDARNEGPSPRPGEEIE